MAVDVKKGNVESLIAIVNDSDIAACIEEYCSSQSISDPKIRVLSDPLSEATALVNGGANIVIVQAGNEDDETLLKLERLCGYVARGGSFLVILDDPTTQTVRRLFRSGVTDVLPTPVAKNEIIAALNTARANVRTEALSTPGEGKIVSLMKTAGGVGATTVAINLARELIDTTVGGVAVIDLDIQFGAVGMALDLKPRMNINDAIRAGDRLDGTLLSSIMTQHQSGFDVLPSATGITPLSVIEDEFVTAFCAQLKQSYEIVLIDLPIAWSSWSYSIIEASDMLVPVVETSVRSADGARRLIQGLKDLGVQDKPLFGVANKVDKGPTTKERLKNLGSILRSAPDAIIRADEKLAMECADIGKCFKDASSNSSIVQDYASAARKLMEKVGVDTHRASSAPSDKKGLRIGKFSILGGKQ